ncbi:PREDICTED: G-box-binding factor 4-like isoform X2 [Lupinus angustifolius]|uniref:G-box-binding factor 4-like isoform X2 n=1 Tax=Lupinus angustifolius TaxID=3871 RepID=UPI00092EBA69|nr:PREDICTED: G-box-binding factor 4-like isoform X2 [Lupinus angustifolius]
MASSKVVVATNPDQRRNSSSSSSSMSSSSHHSLPSLFLNLSDSDHHHHPMDDLLNSIYHTDAAAPPPPPSRTADEVWKEIVAGNSSGTHQNNNNNSNSGVLDVVTLEDYLIKERVIPNPSTGVTTAMVQFGNGVDGTVVGTSGGGGGKGKRKVIEETIDKATLQKQRRMIKNRESAARSRERKQAYTSELEYLVHQLEEENARLLNETADKQRQRFKQAKFLTSKANCANTKV